MSLLFRRQSPTPTPPAGLTPKAVADGWLALFDDETLFGWKEDKIGWAVRDGQLEATEEANGPASLQTTTPFADFELRFECWAKSDSGPAGSFWVRDPKHELPIADTRGKWITCTVHAEGMNVRAAVQGQRSFRSREKNLAVRGPLTLNFSGHGILRIRRVQLKPLGLKPLFNGKNLDGWQEIPGHKSVYSVTPEGWLNVKNGNGQLQSTSQWGNFTLQLEIIANGTHLNSGIFFRESPGLFWNGYEAQIRNQWQGDDRNKAVDYGTGGLYNRQPARRVVSTDREWFTMTVIAVDKHYASWVNGYPVGDFTDPRPDNQDNARSGARTKAGVIGIQGHDPTTDLSFRNIRISEYPAGQ